jgi:hypothetical protein
MLMACQKPQMKIPNLFFLQMTQVSLSLAPTLQILKISDSSCVNNEVESFNNKLMKLTKPFKFSSLLRIEQRREIFTRHGMHLNATGKALVMNR